MEITEKYLPVGTVALLKGGQKRVMITGFCSTPDDDPERVFDYSGCVYPEGYLSSNQVCLFDHEQIDKVFFTGFVDEEETQFKQNLKAFLASREGGVAPATTPAATPPAPVPAVEPIAPVVPEVAPIPAVEMPQIPAVELPQVPSLVPQVPEMTVAEPPQFPGAQ